MLDYFQGEVLNKLSLEKPGVRIQSFRSFALVVVGLT